MEIYNPILHTHSYLGYISRVLMYRILFPLPEFRECAPGPVSYHQENIHHWFHNSSE